MFSFVEEATRFSAGIEEGVEEGVELYCTRQRKYFGSPGKAFGNAGLRELTAEWTLMLILREDGYKGPDAGLAWLPV